MSEPESIEPKPAASAPPLDDSASQALSDALRSSFVIVKIIMAGLLVVFLASGLFTVKQSERAVILRLGKPVGEGEGALLVPGWHWAFPKPIDQVEKIPYSSLQVADSTVGWFSPDAPVGSSLNPAAESYALTSDTNIIHVRATLQYHIADPIRFHFDFADAPVFVTNAINNALLFATGQFTVDEVLATKTAAFREMVESRVTELVDQENLGIKVDQVGVEAVPPRSLAEKFNQVLEASVKAAELYQNAQIYTNETVSKARAEYESRVNAAEAARSRDVALAASAADQFTSLLPEYERNPELFMRIRQMKALENIYAQDQERFLPLLSNPHELRLQLSREPESLTSPTNNLPGF